VVPVASKDPEAMGEPEMVAGEWEAKPEEGDLDVEQGEMVGEQQPLAKPEPEVSDAEQGKCACISSFIVIPGPIVYSFNLGINERQFAQAVIKEIQLRNRN